MQPHPRALLADPPQAPQATPGRAAARPMIMWKVAAVIFVTELLIMWGLSRASIQDPWVTSFIDATLLTLISSVVIHGWVFSAYVQTNEQARASTQSSEQRWRFALHSAGAGMWELDLQSGAVYYAPRCKEILGYADHEVENTIDAWRRLTHPDDLPRVMADMKAYLDGTDEAYQTELRMLSRDGAWRWLLERCTVASRSDDGKPLRLVGTLADITGQRQMQDELRALATTDALTGLANRRHFLARLEDAHTLAQRQPEQSVSILMLDIDHFKRVNDTHGHPAGDAVIKHLAALMSQIVRKTDTVGRMGGEEFAIALVGADLAAAQAFAERLRGRVQASALVQGGLTIAYTISIGVALMDVDDPDIDSTLARADSALYCAKQAGRNGVHVDPQSVIDAARSRTTAAGFVKLQWREAYESGSPLIDHQHRGLFESSNQLLNAMVDNQSADSVATLIQGMFDQIATHFDDEERLLAQAGWPQLDEHRRLHRTLLARAGQFAERHRRGELPIGEVFSFVAHDVAARHLLREDRRYFEFLKAHAEDAAACPA